MSYLLDTNVVSELRRRAPSPLVAHWFKNRPAGTLYLSVLTLGELRKGVEALADTPRRLALLDWLETDLPSFFAGRVLPVDAKVADQWGRMLAKAGRPVPVVDSLLAATAQAHGLILVTRNLKDVAMLDVQTLNPWDPL